MIAVLRLLAIRVFVSSAIPLLGLSLLCESLMAQTAWPTWRGPNGNGTAAAGQYPTAWSENEGIRWRVPLNGRGASTPVDIAGRLVLTLGVGEENTVLCIDRDGKEVWRTSLGQERAGKNAKASGANSSPVTDGENVYAYFKSGDFACLTSEGKIAWRLNIQDKYGEDSLWWDLGTSPILTKDCVVVAVMQTGPSFLLALDKKTGLERWRADRWLDVREEANQSYTTPTLATVDGEDAIVTLGADHVTAHRVTDGELLWKLGGFNPANDGYFRSIASPVLSGDLVICPYARGSTLTAVRLAKGLDDNARVAWKLDFGSDVPTPVVSAGRCYLLSDRGSVSCLDTVTGNKLWTQDLPKSNKGYSSSPLLAGGNLYCVREDATTFVLQGVEGSEPKMASKNTLDGYAVASPIAIDGRIYLRTYENLYCIE